MGNMKLFVLSSRRRLANISETKISQSYLCKNQSGHFSRNTRQVTDPKYIILIVPKRPGGKYRGTIVELLKLTSKYRYIELYLRHIEKR